MTTLSFETDIRPIFEQDESYLKCMRHQTVSTEEGAFPCDLSDYETVKALSGKILWTIRDAWKDGKEASFQAMPKGKSQLTATDIKTFADWIDQGMPA